MKPQEKLDELIKFCYGFIKEMDDVMIEEPGNQRGKKVAHLINDLEDALFEAKK